MKHPYDDILHLPHPTSSRFPRMAESDRAAQFAPFAALTGYDDAVAETARYTEQRIPLAEDSTSDLNLRLQILREHLGSQPSVTVTYFCPDQRKSGGFYRTVSGAVTRIDDQKQMILIGDLALALDDILYLESELFETLLW